MVIMKPSYFAAGLIGVLALLLCRSAGGAPVTESEAISLAEWWYAAEVNAPTTALPAAEKQARVAAKNRHTVSYVVGRDNFQSTRKTTDAMAAYVVAFEPSGLVVVSGEDTLQPVLVFSAAGSFDWSGDPKTNYLAYYLGRSVAGAVEQERSLAVKHTPHANWTLFREQIKSGMSQPTATGTSSANRNEDKGGTYVLLPTALWGQGSHYNNVCMANNGGIGVPTGCVATAMAIKFRFHQWPWAGNGSHSYSDTWGSVKYPHSVNFGTQTFNWDNMPTNSLSVDNSDIANLMYDCGVAVDMDYEAGSSGAWPYGGDISPAINNYFRYRGTYVINSRTTSDHTPGMMYCIQCGVPVVVGTDDHCFVACGYRNTLAPYFYFNMGWDGGNNAWYDVTDIIPDSNLPLNGSLPYSTPNDYAYVDGVTSGGNGNLQTPYQTVASGVSGVSSSGVLWLKTGQYTGNGGLLLNKPMTINSYLGAATVGN
jgi:hypothetical protein